ncbi:MAG: alpha/beta fold hydrolase [Actinomycetes bacterium]
MAARRPRIPSFEVVGDAASTAAAVAARAGAGVQRFVDGLVDRRRPPDLVDDPDGYAVHVVSPAGEAAPGAPVVIAETGLGGVAADWVPVMEHLGGRAAVWAADRPGLGWSVSRPDGDGGVRGALQRTALIRDRAGVTGSTVLVGWSLGALYAMGVAAVRPDLVSGLVLVDPSHPAEARRFADPSLHPAGRLALMTAARLSSLGGAAMAGIPGRRYLLRSGAQMGRSLPPDTVTFASARSGRAIFEELARFSDRCDEFEQIRQQVGLPDVPTVVLTAADRPAAERPAIWEELHADLAGWFPQAELRAVHDSTHHMTVDRPDAVADAIADVVARSSGTD